MNPNPDIIPRVMIIIFLIVIFTVFYGVYQQIVFVKKQRNDLLKNYEDEPKETMEFLHVKFRNKVQDIHEILKIKDLIKNINMEQRVYNKKLGNLNNITSVIVIQVHSNVYYLHQLLISLSIANGIDKALLIFSHDFFGYDINQLIRSVNFAKYIRIFYPYSIQLHPNVFPGQDDQFCSEGYVCKKSDLRNPEAAQAKHHWWWVVNQVFDNMEITQRYNGTILFLEEGDYVTEDFLYVNTLLRYVQNLHCPFCQVLSLGAHKPRLSQYSNKSVMSVEVWTNKMPRTGIAFDRYSWQALKSNSEVFCYHDDFNWDSSFRHVGEQKWEGYVYMAAIAGPRVFRLGQCDNQNENYNVTCSEYEISQVLSFIKLINRKLYPWGMIIVEHNEEEFDEKPAGLWGDVRDRELCMHFCKKSTWY